MDDLERYKEKINHVEESSLELTRNMLAMMEEVCDILRSIFLTITMPGPSHGDGHPQRRDEASREDPHQDGEVVWTFHLPLEQVSSPSDIRIEVKSHKNLFCFIKGM